jgi:hypothetical protein
MKKSVSDYKSYRCPVTGCEHKARSVPGLSAHMRKVHPKDWKGTVKATLRKLGKADLVTEVDAAGIARGTKPRRKQKRRPQKRGGKPSLQRAAKLTIPMGEVKFCPRCSCNIEAVAFALRFAEGQR